MCFFFVNVMHDFTVSIMVNREGDYKESDHEIVRKCDTHVCEIWIRWVFYAAKRRGPFFDNSFLYFSKPKENCTNWIEKCNQMI